jgi:hypothetical protein
MDKNVIKHITKSVVNAEDFLLKDILFKYTDIKSVDELKGRLSVIVYPNKVREYFLDDKPIFALYTPDLKLSHDDCSTYVKYTINYKETHGKE